MTTSQILRRIGQAVLVLLVTFTLAFIMLSALPGDAVSARYSSPDLGLSPEQIAQIRESYGADESLIAQYFSTLGGFLVGNFGYSVQTGTAVATQLAEALPGTLTLAILAFLLAAILALVISILATMDRFAWIKGIFQALPPFFVSLPSFWLGIILIQIVSFRLGWVPVIGTTPAQGLILPTITLSIPITAPLAQVLIRSIEEVKAQPFIAAVRARGAGEMWIFFRNIIRNALLPTLTIAGILFGELIGGAVVTETVFGRAGLGQMTVNAVANRDMPVMLAIVVIAAAVYVLINLIVDLLYPVLDARLRRRERA